MNTVTLYLTATDKIEGPARYEEWTFTLQPLSPDSKPIVYELTDGWELHDDLGIAEITSPDGTRAEIEYAYGEPLLVAGSDVVPLDRADPAERQEVEERKERAYQALEEAELDMFWLDEE